MKNDLKYKIKYNKTEQYIKTNYHIMYDNYYVGSFETRFSAWKHIADMLAIDPGLEYLKFSLIKVSQISI